MKTFPGWREVGHAMRWARSQACVSLDITRLKSTTEYRWDNGDHGYVAVATWDTAEVRAGNGWTGLTLRDADAATILDILAGLNLIPARFSGAYHDGRLDGLSEAAEVVSAARQPSHRQAHGHEYTARAGGTICAAVTKDGDGVAYQCGRRP